MNKLIKLQDKFILVSDEAKINGDECIHLTTFNKSIHHDIDNNLTKWWKIISENPNFSLLSEEDCKTIGWVDVEKLIKPLLEECFGEDVQYKNESVSLLTEFYQEGFKTAQSLNDKMFSLEDIRKIINHIEEIKDFEFHMNEFHYGERCCKGISPISIEEYIQSLQQTSWDVEIEMGYMKLNDDGQEYGFPDMTLPKIINNSTKVTKIL